MTIKVYWSLCKLSGYSCQILMKLGFSRQVFEKYSNTMRIRPVGTELFHPSIRTDGRTDMTKLIFAFRNFAKALKAEKQHGGCWLLNYYWDTQRMFQINLDVQLLVKALTH